MPTNSTLYDTDFYAWANEQAALLRAGLISEADIQNIAEEIEGMGRSEERELVNRLTVLLVHLMKWAYQPALRSNSSRRAIQRERLQLDEHLTDNPSLTAKLDDAMSNAYRHARVEAEHEIGIFRRSFPPSCPFNFDDMKDPEFWPE